MPPAPTAHYVLLTATLKATSVYRSLWRTVSQANQGQGGHESANQPMTTFCASLYKALSISHGFPEHFLLPSSAPGPGDAEMNKMVSAPPMNKMPPHNPLPPPTPPTHTHTKAQTEREERPTDACLTAVCCNPEVQGAAGNTLALLSPPSFRGQSSRSYQ